MICRLFDIEFDHPPGAELRFDQGLRQGHGSVDAFATLDGGVELVVSVVWRPQADLAGRGERAAVDTEGTGDALARYNDLILARMGKQLRGLHTVEAHDTDVNDHRGVASELEFSPKRWRRGKAIWRRQVVWHCDDSARVLAFQVSAYREHRALALAQLERTLAGFGCHAATGSMTTSRWPSSGRSADGDSGQANLALSQSP